MKFTLALLAVVPGVFSASESLMALESPSRTLSQAALCGSGLSQCSQVESLEARLCPVASGLSGDKMENIEHLQCLCLADSEYWNALAGCRCLGVTGEKLKRYYCENLKEEELTLIIYNLPTDSEVSLANAITNSYSSMLTAELLTDSEWSTAAAHLTQTHHSATNLEQNLPENTMTAGGNQLVVPAILAGLGLVL